MRTPLIPRLAACLAGAWLALAPAGATADEAAAGYPIARVPFTQVRLRDSFWSSRLETNRTVTIPFGFKKSEEEGRIRNFERAAKRLDGPYEGKMPFDDTDVYKLIEGASYSLQSHPDPSSTASWTASSARSPRRRRKTAT